MRFRVWLTASAVTVVLVAGSPVFHAQERPGVPVPAPTSPFWGGVPTGTASAQPIALSLYDALHRALEHNLGVLSAEDAVDRANGARWLALADLLPNVHGSVSETERKTSLEAFGFPLQPSFPRVVGPYDPDLLLRTAIAPRISHTGPAGYSTASARPTRTSC